MTLELQRYCEEFISNRAEIEKVFKMEMAPVYPVCSGLFLSHRQTADAQRLKECRQYIKNSAGIFNYFRGTMQAPAASMLACAPDPQEKLSQAMEYYDLLKKHFSSCNELVMAALMLTELTEPSDVNDVIEHSREVYELMREKHRFLTGSEDILFSLLLTLTDRKNEDIINDIENCFEPLKGFAGKNTIQIIGQIFALKDSPSEEKCSRFIKLYDAVRAAGIKYGRYHELPVLAALSLNDSEISQIVSDIAQVDGFLKGQKHYKGVFGIDRKTRSMHAAMLLSNYYSPSAAGDAAAAAVMLAVIASEIVMMSVIAATAASSASSN